MAKKKTINMVKSQVIYKDYSKDAERTALVSGENLSHMFGKIARWYTDISWVGHKHVVADITDFPTLGTAASKDVPASGDAGNDEVVMGNDSRLTDARTPTSHTHSVSEITDFPTLGTAAEYNVPSSGDASNNEVVLGNDSRLSDARTPLSHTHTEADITNLGTYAGASTKGGAATSANKLNIGNSDIGNSTTPVYFDSETGLPIALSYTIEKSIPADAVFTDTTYSTMGPSGSSHAGGLVPDTPSTAGTSKFLREDGTWAVPPNSEYVHPSYTPYSSGLYKITVDTLGHVSAASAVTGADLPSHSHTVSDITNFPTLGTAAGYDVPDSGDADDDEVVLGNDSRLSDARTPLSHTHTEADISDLGTYAGSSTKGGAATSANKLNIGSSDIGSETKPVYFSASSGKPVACAYSLNASVPANAVFTDINVKQSPSTADESREVLFAGNTGNTETTGTTGKSNKLYFNPSTGALTATSFSGSVDASNLTGSIDAARLPNSGVTANSYGPAAGGTLTYGGTFDVPYVTVDKYGRLTAASTKTFTMPAQYTHPSYTSKTSGLYKITVDSLGHVSATAAVTASDLPSHSHTLNMASSTGSSSITLAANTKYQLTAGGSTYIFTTPTDTVYTHPTYTEKTNGLYKITVDSLGHVSATAAVTASDLPSHTHPYLPDTTKYAGSSSVGGAATSANKLNIGSSNIGNSTTPVYFDSTTGLPVALNYTIAKSVPADAKFTDTVYTHPTYTAKASGLYKITVDELGHVSAASAVTGTDLPSHSHNLSIASSTGTSQISLSANTKYQLTAGGSTYIFTTPADNNTTYSVASGDNNGQIKITPSSGDAYNVSVKGLGSAAYTNSSAYAAASHTHDSIQLSNIFTLSSAGWYRIFELNDTNENSVKGALDNSCEIIFKRYYAYTNNEHHEITLLSVFNNMSFVNEVSKSNSKIITKIRYVYTSNHAYIDIYYNGSAANQIITMITKNYGGASWKNMTTITTVPETTTGETIAASYNFSDNVNAASSGHTHSNYLGAKSANGFYGMASPSTDDTVWIRTTSLGLIPYQSGAAGSGHQSLGTSSWYFSAAYIDTVYGSLSGNAASATKLTTNAGSNVSPVYFSGGVPVACKQVASGAYFSTVPYVRSDGVMDIGRYLDFHTSNTSTSLGYRIDQWTTNCIEFYSPGTNNRVNIFTAGSGYAQLSFQLNASNKAYTATGIVVNPLTTSGSVMRIESGGNMIIGAGESPSTLYSNDYDSCASTEQECLYLSADNSIVFITGVDAYANRKEVILDTDGNFRIGPGQVIVQTQNSTSNYTELVNWWKGGTNPGNYGPSIGQHNTGDTDGSIIILPYHTTSNPWDAGVGLYVSKTRLLYNGTAVSLNGHTHSYLPLSGGTMTGNITFTSVTSTSYPASSNQLYWSGSTDWARIYYRVDASDAGRLVLDIGDDTNTRIDFAYNGTTKSYIDTNGNFSGNAASATKLGSNAGGVITPVYFSGGKPVACNVCGSSGGYFNNVARIESDGVMEIGAYIDMHTSTNSANDYDYRITNTSTSGIEFGSRNGNNSMKLYSPSGYNQIRFHTAETDKAYNATGITVYPLTVSGSVMVIESGGNMIIGAGESPSAVYTNDFLNAKTVENEYMFVTADEGVVLISGANTFSNAKSAIFDSSGAFRPTSAGTLSVGRSDCYWNKAYITQTTGGKGGGWISARDNATVKSICVPASSSYCPVVSVKTNNGEWSIGSLGSTSKNTENLYFSYTTDTNYSAGTNTASTYYISTGGWFSGTAAKADVWTTARTLTIGSTGKSVNGSVNVSWSLSEIGAAAASHTHNYIPNTSAGLSAAINLLDTGDSDPVDADYYISQYAGGGTTYTTYYRRPVSKLWNYIKGKADSVYAAKSHSHSYIPLSGSTAITGELASSSANAFRAYCGGYGAFFRNDGSYVYLLFTDKKTDGSEKTANWNSLRPFYCQLSSGYVTMENGLSVKSGLTASAITTTGYLKLGYTNNSTLPSTGIYVNDIRSVNVPASGIGGHLVNFYFHMADSPDTSRWWSIMHVKGWEGAYCAWELAGTAHNTDDRTRPLYVRCSNTNTAWGSWRKIYDTSNKPTLSELGAASSSHTHKYLIDPGASAYKVEVAWEGASVPTSETTYPAVYTTYNMTSGMTIRLKETTWTNVKSFLGLGSAAYTNSSAYASASHTHTYIESKANYAFTSSTLPNSFDWGVSAGFVNSNSGFGSYGSVLTVRTYTGGGGTLQLYAPYSPTYGGTHLKARFGNYDSSSGNSWTSLRELAWNDDKLGANSDGSYWGMAAPNNASNVWIRTTSLGIIPYQSGGAGSGHCGIGTSSWYFSYAYIDNIYGTLHGTAAQCENAYCYDFGDSSYMSPGSYGVVFAADPNITEINSLRKRNDFRINYRLGAANSEGVLELVIGNAVASSTAGNCSGHLTLYNKNGKWCEIYPSPNASSDYNLYLPGDTGTLAIIGKSEYYGCMAAGTDFDTITSHAAMAQSKQSWCGSYVCNGSWYNMISVRHRNGASDGNTYGFYIRNVLTGASSLVYNQQYASGWRGEVTLLDSSNYTDYTMSRTAVVRSYVIFSGSTAITAGKEKTSITISTLMDFSGLGQTSWLEIHFQYSGSPSGRAVITIPSYHGTWVSGVFATNPGGGAPGTYNACKAIGVYYDYTNSKMWFNTDAALTIYRVTICTSGTSQW